MGNGSNPRVSCACRTHLAAGLGAFAIRRGGPARPGAGARRTVLDSVLRTMKIYEGNKVPTHFGRGLATALIMMAAGPDHG